MSTIPLAQDSLISMLSRAPICSCAGNRPVNSTSLFLSVTLFLYRFEVEGVKRELAV